MQGGAESAPLSWDMFEKVRIMACSGIQELFTLCSRERPRESDAPMRQQSKAEEKAPLFSLKNRLQI